VDGLRLLARARATGLRVAEDGGRLVVRGPRSGAPVAEELLAAKGAVLEALAVVARGEAGEPWWEDRAPTGTAPILWLPPRECIAPVACARLGPCPRRAAGRPCRGEP